MRNNSKKNIIGMIFFLWGAPAWGSTENLWGGGGHVPPDPRTYAPGRSTIVLKVLLVLIIILCVQNNVLFVFLC